jgi:hypothetical protein
MMDNGYNVTAIDLSYGKDPLFLQKCCKYHLSVLIDSLHDLKDHFLWDFFKNSKKQM